jgi:hypothetical protein
MGVESCFLGNVVYKIVMGWNSGTLEEKLLFATNFCN